MRIIYPFHAKDAGPLYSANERGYGGFYPVGKNRFWHGGIHLSDPVRPVTALADGEIIAYRVTREALPYEFLENRGEPYSNNFVLMRHSLRLGEKTYTFYSLYMHLLPLSQYSATQKAGAPPIFRQKEYFVTTRRDGAGLRLRSAERKEEILCVIPKGAVGERLDATDLDLCWPIEQQRAAFVPVCYQDLTGYAWLEGRSERLPDGRFRITTVEDRPAPEEMGLSIHEGASDRSPVIGLLPHGSHIPLRTKPKPGQQDFFPLEGEGYVKISPEAAEARDVITPLEYDEVVNLTPAVKVRAGEILGYGGPYRKSNKSLVHFEIFTGDDTLLPALKEESRKRGKNYWQSFQQIAESGGYSKDGLCDVDKLLAMIDRNRDGQIETEEMRTAFNTSANELRRLVCCHPTEWSEGTDGEKWRRLKEPPWNLSDDVYQATLAHIRNMQFWDKVKELPDPKRVWHFHPVAFVEEMKSFLRGRLYTEWRQGFGRDIEGQNEFNEELEIASRKHPNIDPILFKSLMAQESEFNPRANNKFGYTGLTQCSPSVWREEVRGSVGNTKKIAGKWNFDFTNDGRFEPDKSIEGGMAVFNNKMRDVNRLILSKYKNQLSPGDKLKFYLAAYNAGQGTIIKACRIAISNGIVDPTWDDLLNPDPTKSHLWRAIPEEWGRAGKYREITEYVENIIRRFEQ